jgi:hypothetical protein
MPHVLDAHQGTDELQGLGGMQDKDFRGHYIFYF